MNNVAESQLLQDIRQILISARKTIIQTVNSTMVQAYWNVGRLVVEHEQKGAIRAEYGTQQLEQLSFSLQSDFGKGFDVTNLRNMRKFYLTFPIQDSVRPELSWTHYRKLIHLENPKARDWYTTECIVNNWSVRALERQISTLYYERLLSSTNKTPVMQEASEKTISLQIDLKNYLRDPYILDFLNLPKTETLESTVEQTLINNLQKFLLELGRGFAFVARQQRVSVEDEDFYLDLVFYNFKLKCFLLIDIKVGKLSHQDVGQMDTYVRIYDQHYKNADDNPTIGLILSSEKSKAVAKYSVLADNKQLFSSQYLLYLPTEEELLTELKRERNLLDQQS